ncbi:MAG: phage tail sheath family protein [Polyangiaceae bacterium]|nr:phage tail sheath family protein [Polyangiaceae bacterium]
MPEYLAPGVYVEETSFRAKTIEGVSTSTAGFVGPARFGPTDGIPELLTSFAEFERVFGGLEQLQFSNEDGPSHNFLAHAVRAFFDNGGRRLYVARVYDGATGRASAQLPQGSPPASGAIQLTARYPGRAGALEVTFRARVGENVLVSEPNASQGQQAALRGVRKYDTVWVRDTDSPVSSPPGTGTLYWVDEDAATSAWCLRSADSGTLLLSDLDPSVDSVHGVSLDVEVLFPGRPDRPGEGRRELWENLSFHYRHRRAVGKVFAETLENRADALSVPLVFTPQNAQAPATPLSGPEVAELIFGAGAVQPGTGAVQPVTVRLQNGSDGERPGADEYRGREDQSGGLPSSGLGSLEAISDIAIVAAPGYSAAGDATAVQQITSHLISHAERMRYRIAVLDSCEGQSIQQVRRYRAQIDSSHAALYYPWIRVLDPVTETEINLPPSGFVTGIYARNDIEIGVHKAPANEVVRGAISFEKLLNKSQQDVLNPEGVNCFRYFEGRGYRLWGARTVSSDPEWKYVNLRRYFAFLEHSIDVGTQWVVFESNGPALWANVRRTVESFLFNEWKSGHLLGEKPEFAYFVRCDRSTMTQNDLDNGRLVCLIGVAPLRPAEFVIFRIGQFTAQKAS